MLLPALEKKATAIGNVCVFFFGLNKIMFIIMIPVSYANEEDSEHLPTCQETCQTLCNIQHEEQKQTPAF